MIIHLDLHAGRMTYSSVVTILTLLLYQVNPIRAVTGKWQGGYFRKALQADPRAFDKLHIYTTIPDISFAACVDQCKRRYVCGFVNYQRRAKMCYILRTQDPYVTGFQDHIVDMSGYVLGVKSEWQEPEIRDTVTVKQEPTCRPRYHVTSTRTIENPNNTETMVQYTCNATQDMDMRVLPGPDMLIGTEIIQSYTDKCNAINSVKMGHSSCHVMFWDSPSGLNAYDGDGRRMNKVLTVDNGGKRGKWYEAEYCPVGTYAVGYTAQIESFRGLLTDDTALNGVKLHCAAINDTSMRVVSYVTSEKMNREIVSYEYMCRSVSGIMFVLTSFKMKVEQETGSFDETAANSILFRCRDFNGTQKEQRATDVELGKWGQWSTSWSESCPPMSAICGLKTRIDTFRDYDNTALNDVKVFCCRM